MLHTFVIYVKDDQREFHRTVSVLHRRVSNIESFTFSHTDIPGISCMTVAVDIDESNAARLEAHLYKMVNVLQVRNATHRLVTRRQLAMIKVTANEVERAQLKPLLLVFSAHVVGISTESLILEVTGTEEKIDRMLELLRPYGVLEMVRTGSLVLERA